MQRASACDNSSLNSHVGEDDREEEEKRQNVQNPFRDIVPARGTVFHLVDKYTIRDVNDFLF